MNEKSAAPLSGEVKTVFVSTLDGLEAKIAEWRERAETAERAQRETEQAYRTDVAELNEEIRALRASRNRWMGLDAPRSRVEELEAENRKLRDALRDIEQKFPKSDAAWLARAALAATEEPDGR